MDGRARIAPWGSRATAAATPCRPYTATMPLRLLILTVFSAIVGCASTPPPTDPLSSAPDDMTIDVTILAGRSMKLDEPAHRRTGKVIVFADGSVHADWGPQVSWKTRPGLTRTLRREQTAELWELMRQLGYADPANGEAPRNLGLITPDRREVVYLCEIAAEGDRWAFTRRQPADQAGDPSWERFVRALAALAWERDEALSEARIEPNRYDFGPDPYARYRNVEAGPSSSEEQ